MTENGVPATMRKLAASKIAIAVGEVATGNRQGWSYNSTVAAG